MFSTWSWERKTLKRRCKLPSPFRPETGCGSTRAALAMQPRPQTSQESMEPLQTFQETMYTLKFASRRAKGALFPPCRTLYFKPSHHLSLFSLLLQRSESSLAKECLATSVVVWEGPICSGQSVQTGPSCTAFRPRRALLYRLAQSANFRERGIGIAISHMEYTCRCTHVRNLTDILRGLIALVERQR
jgi:hypothetical protein